MSLANTFVVTTTNDSGPGSLRQAILDANATPGKDIINFNIGTGTQTLQPLGPLPTITDAVIIDATTQTGFSSAPIIELDGSFSIGDGLTITAGDSLVQGLVINRFSGIGIRLTTGGNNIIRGNHIGTDLSGEIALGNGMGMHIESSAHNTIGGTGTPGRNVISGNRLHGVNLFRGDSNEVLGNYIGISASGTADLGNGNTGIAISEASNNIIGGPTPEARNVISGNNEVGMLISGSQLRAASGNKVEGNYIGTNAAGTAALGNRGDGVYVLTANDSVIGGATPGAGNLVSGNGGGVKITGGANNRIEGNYIGTDRSGTYAISNPGGGVTNISAANTRIGGTTVGARNVISGNGQRGIWIFDSLGATGVEVQGNYIGTQADGISPLGNASHGVLMNNLARGNKIGGQSDAGNVIAYNGGAGVANDVIGGMGVPSGNSITSNRIFSNSGLGIGLFSDGVTLNEPGDSGNNGAQNFPVLTAAQANGAGTIIQGTLNSRPDSSFSIDFFSNSGCDPSGHGEGQRYFGTTTVATDNDGNVSFHIVLPVANIAGTFFTATTTNASGHTSEFSQCVQVTQPLLPVLLTEAGSARAIALDSVTMVRDPFPVATLHNFSLDQRTRVVLFAINVVPGPIETTLTAQAQDSSGMIHPLPIEYVGKVPNFDWLTQIVVKLPDEISSNGDVNVSISFLGLTSNRVLMGIRAP